MTQRIERPGSKQPIPEHAEKVFTGVMFDVYQWEQEQFDGSTATFEKLKRPDTVIVFPVLDDGCILLTEEEQPGRTQPVIGGAGGRIDLGEEVLDAAAREMREETGHEANEFVLWKALQPVNKIDWAVYFFVAHGCRKIAEIAPDPGEKISLKPVSFDEFVEIGANDPFYEHEIVPDLLSAKLDPEKMEELRRLFRIAGA